MRQRYRLYKRKNGGRYYIHDDVTGKQESLGTNDRATAVRLFHSRKEAEQQPAVNLQIARAYLAASDPQIALLYFSIRNKNSLFGNSASLTHSFVQRIPAMTFFR